MNNFIKSKILKIRCVQKSY